MITIVGTSHGLCAAFHELLSLIDLSLFWQLLIILMIWPIFFAPDDIFDKRPHMKIKRFHTNDGSKLRGRSNVTKSGHNYSFPEFQWWKIHFVRNFCFWDQRAFELKLISILAQFWLNFGSFSSHSVLILGSRFKGFYGFILEFLTSYEMPARNF